MQDPISPDTRLALDLALTLRHDGHGGVTDDLADREGLTAWLRAHPELTSDADKTTLVAVRELRAAVRSLFAHAVRPAAPSPADADVLPPVAQALHTLNAAAARRPVVPVLTWAQDTEPERECRPAAGPDDLVSRLARAAIAFLAGPDRHRLRACHAPRCVRYFLKEHPRQEWCKPSCGNRARVARHHERHRKIT
ncbi:CGNR zinc finger domain-containing protein [Streptomyces sp. NPDC014006]|uniref:CGNR zinc finger domain-containing protein n=1 Tax=Streptomyces sp. NPDC014006 TaxID=3364870 RepID=UPI0036F53E38